MTDQWCLCWSQAQNAVHIEPLATHLSSNRDAYRDDRVGDYRVLVVGIESDVRSAADAMRPTLFLRADDRAMRRAA